MIAEFGANQIVFPTDYPFLWATALVGGEARHRLIRPALVSILRNGCAYSANKWFRRAG